MVKESFKARVKTQGRIVVPYNVRRSLSLKAGDLVRIEVEKEAEQDE